jgi:protein SCO1/2
MKHLLLLAFAMVAFALALTGCTNSGGAKDKLFDVKGKVVSADAEKKKITLDHEAIPGLMGAMTMPFDVENPKLLDGLKAGDAVQGKLRSKDGKHTLTELTKQ